MTTEPGKAIGGSCLGGVLGAVLGIVIGGFVGPAIARSNNDLKRSPDPTGRAYGQLLDPCAGAFGLIVGVSVGGILGAVGGSVLGVGLATSASRSATDSEKAALPQNDYGKHELQRLRARLAELEAVENDDNLSPPEHPRDSD